MPQPEFGVIFDVDGVLIDSYGAHLKTWQICCQRHGRECTEAQFAAGFGRTSREVIRDTWSNPPSDAEIAAFDEEKEILYRELVANDFPHMPGARELIKALQALNIPMAIGSSGPPRNVELAIEKLEAKMLDGHLHSCVVEGIEGGESERVIGELLDLYTLNRR